MKNLKEISVKDALVINGGVAPVYDEDGNLIGTCTGPINPFGPF